MPVIHTTHQQTFPQLDVPPRILLGPGPSNTHPRVMQAMGMPTLGHLDPAFLTLMGEVQELLRYAWQTDNEYTLAISGTGTAAMETAVANLVEPGDVVLVGVIGYFGQRLVEMAGRYGGNVHTIEKAWGETFTLAEIEAALVQYRPAILMLVHAETSTGALQPLAGIGALCHAHNCLFLTDSVTSLGAAPLFLDAWEIDVAYSCSQKGLSCPPGASPITFSPRALHKLENRKHKVGSWYFDITLLRPYWFGATRSYHHTMSSNMIYALREGLRLVAEEGLEARWQRHQANAHMLWDGLAALDLTCHVPDPAQRIPSLTTVRVPDGLDAAAIAKRLLHEYNIEIAGGFSKLAGKVWRIGLMGYNSRAENVALLLHALQRILHG